ncbi:hypothetical protein HYX16_02370 [Candidatus Woesearchaeota archaeon]|nr:hypothetical protein [Candidatus Woesearchaeota archaeon]
MGIDYRKKGFSLSPNQVRYLEQLLFNEGLLIDDFKFIMPREIKEGHPRSYGRPLPFGYIDRENRVYLSQERTLPEDYRTKLKDIYEKVLAMRM